jgi:hypothetical protein
LSTFISGANAQNAGLLYQPIESQLPNVSQVGSNFSKILGANEFHRYRLSLHGGVAQWLYRIADVPEELQQHYRDLRGGYYFGGNFTYYTGAEFGIGLRYDHFITNNSSIASVKPDEQSPAEDVNLSDDVTIQFVGPQASIRYYSDDSKKAFLMGIGLGYTAYRDEGVNEFSEAFTTTGNNFGIVADFSGDFYLGDYGAFGVGLTMHMSNLQKFTTEINGEKISGEYDRRDQISLTYVALNVGFRLVR